jgi:glycosyltransferase involved in cell wall biosynthesis
MNILQINKFFYPRGGVEVVFFETIAGLRARGHQVAEFSTQHPKNLPSVYHKYFASELPELLGTQSPLKKLQTFLHLLHSSEVESKLTRLIKTEQPQVAHLHSVYHHLSASTFTTLRKLKIPTIVTLHDFFPLSPSRNFLVGETINEPAYKKPFACVRSGCINNTFSYSLAGDLEAYYYRFRHIWKNINLFICPSQFMADKMVEWGYPREKMRVILNPFQPPASIPDLPLGNKVLFLGRIHYEKGIKQLLEAARLLPNIPFLLVGTGPDENWVKTFIKENNLKNVEHRGYAPHGSAEYFTAIREAKVMVTPSLFYENCSIAILETLYYERIAVATDRGGNPEMIQNGKTGFLAKPEDSQSLAQILQYAMETSTKEAKSITAAGKKLVIQNYSLERYLDQLEAVYREVAH